MKWVISCHGAVVRIMPRVYCYPREHKYSHYSSIGYFFRALLRWRWKMAALPLPIAILDDLICKWGHPRWWPEAEGPPFSTSTSIGLEKSTPGPGWHHFRRRHHRSNMVASQMTSGGRRDAREDIRQTPAPSLERVQKTSCRHLTYWEASDR